MPGLRRERTWTRNTCQEKTEETSPYRLHTYVSERAHFRHRDEFVESVLYGSHSD